MIARVTQDTENPPLEFEHRDFRLADAVLDVVSDLLVEIVREEEGA